MAKRTHSAKIAPETARDCVKPAAVTGQTLRDAVAELKAKALMASAHLEAAQLALNELVSSFVRVDEAVANQCDASGHDFNSLVALAIKGASEIADGTAFVASQIVHGTQQAADLMKQLNAGTGAASLTAETFSPASSRRFKSEVSRDGQ